MADPVTGKLLFYTNGSTVWNGAGVVVKTLVCDSCTTSSQAAVIVPFPGREGRYYLFTTADQSTYPGGEARVATVDVAGSNIAVGEPELISSGVTEKVVTIKACNGSDYWVVFKMIDGSFHSYRVKFGAGFDASSRVVSNGVIPIAQAAGVNGQMTISPDGSMLAAVNDTLGVELYRFNTTTGQLAFVEQWGKGVRHYGCSFSPDSKLLYIGRGGTETTEERQILQYDVSAAPVAASADVIGATAFGYAPGGMQLAPNGRMYVARPSSTVLAAVMAPNVRGRGCGFVDSHINIPGGTVSADLPAFASHLFTTQFVGRDTVVCANQPIQLGVPAVPGFTYLWTPADVLDDFTFARPTAVITIPTTFTVIATNPLGCQIVQTMTVGIIAPPTVKTSRDTTVCPGSTITLKASGGVAYRWRQAPGLVNASSATPQVTPSRTTTYVVDVTDSIGCVGTDSVIVYVSPDPDRAFAGRDTTVCIGEPFVLGMPALVGLRYEWTPAEPLNDPTAAQPTGRITQTTTFRLRIIEAARGCETTRQVTVTAVPRPAIVLTKDTTICAGASVPLRASGGLRYQWSPSSGLSDTTLPTVIATPAQTTTYVVGVAGATGCTAYDTVTVTVRPTPAPQIEAPKGAICSCDSVEILAPAGYASYEWSNGRIGPRLVIREPGSYAVRVVDNNGCRGVSNTIRIDSAFIEADVDLTLSAPTARDGKRVDLGISLRNADEVASCLNDEVRLQLRMTPKVLIPTGVTSSFDVEAMQTFVTLRTTLQRLQEQPIVIPCTVTLGGADTAVIGVTQLADDACKVTVRSEDVTFTVDEICRIGGIPRLFHDGNIEGIVVVVQPNPASDIANVRVLSAHQGPLQTTILDLTGRVIRTLHGRIVPGWTTTEIPLADLGSGIYVLQCTTPNGSATSMIEVHR